MHFMLHKKAFEFCSIYYSELNIQLFLFRKVKAIEVFLERISAAAMDIVQSFKFQFGKMLESR